MHKIDLFKDYENAKLDTVESFREKNKASTYRVEDIENHNIDGLPVCVTLNLLMKKKNKPNFVISDPKQELFSNYSGMFEAQGYNVYVIDFTDYTGSDCWNPLTKYFRLYQKQFNLFPDKYIYREHGFRQEFNGKVYTDYDELAADIEEWKTD